MRHRSRWAASRAGRQVRTAAIAIFGAAIVWTAVLLLAGGFDVTLAGLRIRSNNPTHVAMVAAAALAAFFLSGGSVRAPLGKVARAIASLALDVSRRHGAIAGLLAILTTIAGLQYSTRIAGDSDAYGYVSEADRWLSGPLKQDVPWIGRAPWPQPEWLFSPPGYKPVQLGDRWTIVPTYSPGLPLLFAAAKRIAGHCAIFVIVPLFGGLAVLGTFALGKRMGAPLAGLIAAWFVATSPAMLSILMEPLTDVPVMAAWTWALFFLLGASRASTVAAGLSAALAILIRPNLVPLIPILAAWFLVRARATVDVRRRILDTAMFVGAALPGVLATAAINRFLYGSATTSGYGGLGEQFALGRIWPNLGHYISWYAESQTPLALLGFAAFAIPLRRDWPSLPDRSMCAILGAFVAALWVEYAAYLEFNSWGFLRFLLPSWPLLMLGTAAVLLSWTRGAGRTIGLLIAAIVVATGVWTVNFADRHGVFDQRQAARHEAILGRLVRARTEPSSVIITLARAGSLRYYSGRLTARYDYLDSAWLDRMVGWLAEQGVHAYALLDQHELEEFRRRFSGQQTTALLDSPAIDYLTGSTLLFDLGPRGERRPATVIRRVPPSPGWCDPPAPTRPLREK